MCAQKAGREGYILYELLEPVPTPTPEPTATPTPTPSPEPTATPDADSETPAPTAAKNAVQDETVYDEPRLVRTLKRANLRKKPDGSRLGEIAADTALTAIGEGKRTANSGCTSKREKTIKRATCSPSWCARSSPWS